MTAVGLHVRWRVGATSWLLSLAAWLLTATAPRCAEPIDPGQPAPASSTSPSAGAAAPAGASGSPGTSVPAGEPDGLRLRYRRVYAAADAMAQWPRGPGRYVPVEKERFERLIGAAEQRQVGPPGISQPAAVAAEYTARLDGDTLASGSATLEVRNQSGQAMPLVLEPMGLAITEPQWEGSPPRPASLGIGDDGRVCVRVDASGRLRWKWSLRGTRDADGALVVALQLPACSSNRLAIDLPAELTLTAESALVSASEATSAGTRRWLVELGGRNRSVLRISPDAASRSGRSGARARSALTCELSPSGIDLIGVLTVDSPQSSTREIALDADPSLELISVRQGEASLSWTVQTPTGRTGRKRYVVAMSEPIRGLGRSLRLHAVAPLALGRRWPVPLLRVEPALWQEATLTLVVPSPLKLEDVRIVKGRQIGWAPLAEPRLGDTAEFQLFGPESAIELTVAHAKSPLAIDSATMLQMRGLELVAQTTASVRAAVDPHFRLEADVSPRWSIDAVESTPPDAVADWTVRPAPAGSPSSPTANGGKDSESGGRLAIRLARSVGPNRTIRVRVSARYTLPPVGRPLTHDDWDPIRFLAPAGGRRWTAVDAAEEYQIKLAGDERLSRVDPSALSSSLLELFPASPRGLIFEVDRASSPLQVAFQIQKPQYTATLRVEAAAVDSSSLHESLFLRCEPQTGRVDRVVLDVKPPPASPLQWSLENEDDQQLTARIVAPAEPGGASSGTQTWEITLRRPRSAPFELRASLSRPFTQRTAVTLLAAPEAASQRGTIAVHATETPPRIETARLSPAVAESTAADRQGFVRASFRYDPARELSNVTSPMYLVPSPGEPPLPSAWIWSAQYESRFDPGGAANHWITLRLQSGGRRRLRVTLPPYYTHDNVVGAWIDHAKTTWSPETTASEDRLSGDGSPRGVIGLDLPAGREFPLIVIQLIRNDAPLGLVATLQPPQIETDVPVLAHRWTAWLPSAYAGPSTRPESSESDPPGCGRLRRVLGPLARLPQQPRFDPFSPDAWLSLTHAAPIRESDRERVAQWLADLRTASASPAPNAASSRAERSTPAAVTWSDYLTVAAEHWPGTLRIDRHALAEADFSARTAMTSVLSISAAAPAAIFQQAEMAVLLVGDFAIVTTTAEVGLHQNELESVAGDVAWRVQPGLLAQRLAESLADRNNPRYLSAEAWKAMPAESRSPWYAGDASSRAALDSVGWTAYQTTAWSDPPPSILVYHRDMATCLGFAAWTAGLAVVLWGSRRFPRCVAVAVGMAAAASLPADGVVATVVRGLFLGGLSGWMVLVFLSRSRRTVGGDRPANVATKALFRSAIRTAAPLMLAVAYGLSGAATRCTTDAWPGAARAYGQESGAKSSVRNAPNGNPAAAMMPLPQVFVPTDDQQRPVGSRYYVPEDFLRRLERAASGGPVVAERWQIHAAQYRGSVQWQAAAEQLEIATLQAVFDIETFATNARIRVSAGAKGMAIVPESVAIDGRTVSPTAIDGSETFEWTVLDPGRYRIEMALRPNSDLRGEQHAFEWRLPRAARARLELSLPADAPTPQVGGALGSVTREVRPSRIVAELGPTDRLSLAWRASDLRSHRLVVDAEEYLWLKVKPGSVVLDVLLKGLATEGRVHFVQVEADPQLQLIAAEGAEAASPQPVAGDGGLQRWRVALPQPAEGAFTLPMQFVWTDNAGVGTLRPPAFRVVGARTTKRWLAVSADRGLLAETADDDRSATVAPSAFLAGWGGGVAPPALAVALSSLKSEWRVAIHPTTAQTAVQQTTSFSLAEGNAEILLDASLTTLGGSVFQHRVQMPAEVEVGRVTLTTQGVERATRWSRAADGALTVFSNAPLANKQQLQVWGRMPIPRRGVFPLPVLRVAGDDAKTSCDIRVLRQPMIRADLVRAPEKTSAESPVADALRLPGRVIAAYRESNGQPAVEVRVEPNRPNLRADQTVILRCNDANWEAEIAMQVHIANGLVDQFRIEIPPTLVGPFKTEPAGTIEISEPDAKGPRLATFRPATAVTGEYPLRIVGALRAPEGEPISAPHVRLVGAEVGRNLVVLPVQQQVQPLWWDTRGLLGTDLPQTTGIPLSSRKAWAAYVVLREPWQARLRLDGRAGAGPHVALADIHVWIGADGNCAGVARFDIEPLGGPECRIDIPPACRIISIVVDGHRVTPEKIDTMLWSIPLSSTGLPQRIEILFSQPLARTSRPSALASPWLIDLPVWQTCWTVQGMHVVGGPPDISLEETRPDEQELLRLRSIASLLETATQEPPADRDAISAWHRQWNRYWTASRNELLRRPAGADDRAGDVAAAELPALERRANAVAEQIGKSDRSAPPASEAFSGDDMLALWSAIPGNGRSAEHWIAAGGAKSVDVVPSDATIGIAVPHGLTALACLGAWIAAVWAVGKSPLPQLAGRWPAAVLLGLAAAWWAWLQPSVLGLALGGVAAVALAFSIATARRQARRLRSIAAAKA